MEDPSSCGLLLSLIIQDPSTGRQGEFCGHRPKFTKVTCFEVNSSNHQTMLPSHVIKSRIFIGSKEAGNKNQTTTKITLNLMDFRNGY